MPRMNSPAEIKPDISQSARQRLRDGTHEAHVRLNRHPMLKGITRPDYPLDLYRVVLVAYFHFYRALEEAIDRSPALSGLRFSYDNRRKLQWLAEDLRFFGIDPDDPGLRPAAPVTILPLTHPAQLLGALYTIEGSSLGGEVISCHLALHLGITPDRGGRFFHGYGDRIAALWKEFEAFIGLALPDEGSSGIAVLSARTTFESLEAVLDEYAATQAI